MKKAGLFGGATVQQAWRHSSTSLCALGCKQERPSDQPGCTGELGARCVKPRLTPVTQVQLGTKGESR